MFAAHRLHHGLRLHRSGGHDADDGASQVQQAIESGWIVFGGNDETICPCVCLHCGCIAGADA